MPEQELRRRVITGAAIGLVIIVATLGGRISSYFLVTLIIAGSCLEFFRMQITRSGNQNIYVPAFLCLTPVFLLTILTLRTHGENLLIDGSWMIASCAVVFGVYFVTQLAQDISQLEKRLFAFGTSLVLFTIPGFSAIFLCNTTPKLLLGIFVLLWSSDIFAYFGGRAFGRHKLLPSVSPKKTWEGLFSGLIATVFTAWGLSTIFKEVSMERWIIIALLVVVFGTSGDLLQSVFKRGAGVKDSGTILPGHGGLWDRFDSFLGCLPWVGVYYLLM